MAAGSAILTNSLTKTLAYPANEAWHGSCDSVNAGGRGAVSQASTPASGRLDFMLTQLTHAKAMLSRRRWLAATAGLALGLSAFSNAKAADDTIKEIGRAHV